MTEKQVCSRDASSVFFRCSCCKEKNSVTCQKKKRKWQTHYSLSDLRLQFMAMVKFSLITANGTIVGISYFFDSFQQKKKPSTCMHTEFTGQNTPTLVAEGLGVAVTPWYFCALFKHVCWHVSRYLENQLELPHFPRILQSWVAKTVPPPLPKKKTQELTSSYLEFDLIWEIAVSLQVKNVKETIDLAKKATTQVLRKGLGGQNNVPLMLRLILASGTKNYQRNCNFSRAKPFK